MRSLTKPVENAETVFTTCTDHIQDAGLKARLQGVKADVGAAVRGYELAVANQTLNRFRPFTAPAGTVTSRELIDVYVLRMAKKGARGRPLYDKLMLSAPDGRCPLCAHRMASTLDHHVAKTHFPLLSVAPTNLVPACSDCNKLKTDDVPARPSAQTLHPYFDNIDADRWLFAEVRHTAPASVKFRVVAPATWSVLTRQRVKHHFRLFGIGALYAAQAGEEIVNIRFALSDVFTSGGHKGVRKHLSLQAASRLANRINSWQTATYEALAADSWFVRGGFR